MESGQVLDGLVVRTPAVLCDLCHRTDPKIAQGQRSVNNWSPSKIQGTATGGILRSTHEGSRRRQEEDRNITEDPSKNLYKYTQIRNRQ